jgi:hypothetical protein
MKAWVVECEEDESSTVVYTRKHSDALLVGAQRLGVKPELCESYRYPEADLFWPKVTTEQLVITLGWWFNCAECGQQVARELEEANPLLVPTYWKDEVFCSEFCLSRYKVEKPQRLRLLDRAKQIVTNMCPDAEIETSYTYRLQKYGRNEVAVNFRFPGGRGSWSEEEPDLFEMELADKNYWDDFEQCGRTVH